MKMAYVSGSNSSPILAIYYLNDIDHYIKEELKIKYYVRFQDDFLLFHNSKKYLKYCLEKIKKYLEKEKLLLNKKTRIYNSNNNYIYLGRSKKGHYSKYREINKKIKIGLKNYKNKKITLFSYISTIQGYTYLNKTL